MKSLSFPVMFKNSKTVTKNDKAATMTNLSLLLKSSKGSLFGDPYFGTRLMDLFYAQNNKALNDIVVDEIYTAIIQFMPQLKLTRQDITITRDALSLYVNITATNSLDLSTDMYSIKLMTGDDQLNEQ